MKASEIAKILKDNSIERPALKRGVIHIFSENNLIAAAEEIEFKLTGKLSAS